MAVLVNIRRSGASAVDAAEIMAAASGNWVVSVGALDEYGDVVLAVMHNRVVGAFDLLSWEDVEDGRVRFELRESEDYAALVGQDSPRLWKRGQANPIAFVDLDVPVTSSDTEAAAAPKPRRGIHRITIETKGLSDTAAAQLHHTLLVVAGASGYLYNHRSTSLVREMKEAQEAAQYSYSSARAPRAFSD